MQEDSKKHETPTDANNVLAVRFISENIIVDRFPVTIKAAGKHSQCQVVINVSDEFYLGNSEEIMKEGKLNYYFPMGESGELMGLNSNIMGLYTYITETDRINMRKVKDINVNELFQEALDHDVTHNDYSNLKALCQRCHNRYDVAYRKENRKTNKGVLSLF